MIETLFSHIKGHAHNKKHLLRSLENNTLASVYLFHGPDGVGKKEFAKAIGAYLVGQEQWRTYLEKGHPDLHIYFPEGKTHAYSIQKIRSLTEELTMQPFSAPKGVFILDDAERMPETSSNALLKTLEEPHVNCFLFLISSHLEELLPTIVSRCQQLRFDTLSKEDLLSLLQGKGGDKSELEKICHIAGGSARKAQLLLQDKPFLEKLHLVERICNRECSKSFDELSRSIEELCSNLEDTKERLSLILTQILLCHRDEMRKGAIPFTLLSRAEELSSQALTFLEKSGRIKTALSYLFTALYF